MKQVIVAIDGSEGARRALQLAAEIARRFDATLTLAHAIPRHDQPGEIVSMVEFEKAHEAYARKLLEDTRQTVTGPRQVTTRLLQGPPAESIARLAEDPEVGMVVVGCRGLGTVGRVLLGSVSDRLTHICPKPVLVVR